MADILLSDIDLEKLLILFGNSMNEKQLLLDADKDLAESEDVESAKTWPIPPKIIKEFQKVSKPLEGQELLDKIQELNKSGNLSKSDKVKECGYCVMSDDGEMKLRFMDFYAAVAKAKGN